MNDIAELVDLPDPAVQPLVHPLDLPEARRPLRISWLIAALTSPPVGLLAVVIAWFASRSYVVPLITGAAIIGFGSLASRFFRDQAWAFIPRKRQDRARSLPATWELGSAVVFSAVLAVALLLVAFRLDRPDVSLAVREFTFGMGAAAGLLVALDFVGKLLRHRGAERRRVLFTLPGGGCRHGQRRRRLRRSVRCVQCWLVDQHVLGRGNNAPGRCRRGHLAVAAHGRRPSRWTTSRKGHRY